MPWPFRPPKSVRRTPERRGQPSSLVELPNGLVSPLFQAAIEATEEAIYNSLCMATSLTGYQGHRAEALPLDQVTGAAERIGGRADPSMKTILRILIILAFLALMLFLPAIPVLRNPSMANPETEIVSLSLFNLLGWGPALGWMFFWEWYSSLALGLLLVIMASVSLLIARLRI